MRTRFWIQFSLAVLVLLCASSMFAQIIGPDGVDRPAVPGSTASDRTPDSLIRLQPSPNQYGLQNIMYTWVPGESFRQHLSTNPLTTTTGATNYVTSTATTGWLVAPLDAYLDSGIHLIGVRFYYYDNDAALNPTFYICKSTLDDSIGTNPTFDCLFSGTPTATQPLYTSLRVDTNIDLIRSNGSTEQRFTVWVTNKGSNVQLAGARLIWQRQISPAPATASFVDVPNDGSVFYQAVQALADSGVTLGCDATHFCPNNNVTRLQMALFLARALGLSYHP